MRLRILGGVLLLALNAGSAAAQAPAPATYTVTLMSPELALRMAQAALAACRQAGYQVAVAVADRGGQVQVVLRDRLAGSHTVDAAADKAWTAASFKMGTTALALSTKEGAEASGIRHIRRVWPSAAAFPSRPTVHWWARLASPALLVAPPTTPAHARESRRWPRT